MLMKGLFVLFFSMLFTSNLLAGQFSVGMEYYIDFNQDKRWLEYVSEYEDRWFYEAQGSGEKYHLFLGVTNHKYYLLKESEIKKVKKVGDIHHFYTEQLEIEDTYFEKLPMGGHLKVLTGNNGHHKHERMYGDYAFDLAPVDDKGRHYMGQGNQNSDYYGWDKHVSSPLSGRVVAFDDSTPDNPASPDFTNDIRGLKPNYILIHIGENFYLSLVHFKQHSMTGKVHVGQWLQAGHLLGKLGNSGASYVPHLHMTLYVKTTSGRYVSVPNKFLRLRLKNGKKWNYKRVYLPTEGDILFKWR
jgi:murein DD-endopeptidase MepM/ murein hydrolase activator NlpD